MGMWDAMALVRRSAWDAVGGYTHIQGGWEDYDFWCKLLTRAITGCNAPRFWLFIAAMLSR